MKMLMNSLLKVVVAGVAALCAACSSDDSPGAGKGPVAVEVRGFLCAGSGVSRVSGSVWQAGDAIGVSGGGASTNVRYVTAAGDGFFSSSSGIYIPSGGEVTLSAYYPFSDDLDPSTMEIAFSSGRDFLHAAAVRATHSSPSVSFQFRHRMAQLRYTIIDQNRDPAAQVSGELHVAGFPTSGVFNAATGAVTPSATAGTAVAPLDSRLEARCIVPPKATDTPVTLLIKLDGKTYHGTYSSTKLEAGCEYRYNIDITNADPASPVAISSAGITDWSTVEGGSINVKPGNGDGPPSGKAPEIGDYLMADGTIAGKDDPIAGRTVAGVVFHAANPQLSARGICDESLDNLRRDFPECTHGLAVALANTSASGMAMSGSTKPDFLAWASASLASTTYLDGFQTGSETAVPGVMAGYSYTGAITGYAASVGDGNTRLKAFVETLEAYRAAHPVTGASSWYIPSYAELEAIYRSYDIIRASIEAAGGTLPEGEIDPTDEEFWKFYYSSNIHASGTTRSVWTHRMGEQTTPLRQFNSTDGWLRPVIAF